MNREEIKEHFVLLKNIKTGSVFWTTDDGSNHEVGGIRVLFRSNDKDELIKKWQEYYNLRNEQRPITRQD